MAGTTVESDVSGRFEIFSTLAGTVTLQVTREGFKSAAHTAQWQPPINGAIDVISLESLQSSPVQLDPGEYSLTISMDPATARNAGTLPACAGFPAEMMSRTYTATIARGPFPWADRVVSIVGPTVFSNSQLFLLIGGPFVGIRNRVAIHRGAPWLQLSERHWPRANRRTSDHPGSGRFDPVLCVFPVLRAELASHAGLGKLSTRSRRADGAVPRLRFQQRANGLHRTLSFG